MDGLHSSVYLCSETQERFMWVCPPEITNKIVDHYNIKFNLPEVSDGAMASVIGKIRSDGQYIVHSNGEIIVNAKASQVTKGFLYKRPYKPSNIKVESSKPSVSNNYNKDLIDLLSHENIASRKSVFDQYDKQVQGRIVFEAGQADSGVMAPFNSEDYPAEIRSTGIALSTDHNPMYGCIDPYWAGINAVVESMRNVAAVGATPHALTDCLCFGNPEKKSQMWEFVESVRGITDACNIITLKDNPKHPTPIIAGNVSFYNESKNGSIPPSPIVSCLGKLKNVKKAIGMSFLRSNSNLILVGKRKSEMGGSAYYHLKNKFDTSLPKPDLDEVRRQIFALTDCIEEELILSCHDISDGGLGVALSEMAFENNIGFKIYMDENLRFDEILFSETGGFIMEVDSNKLETVFKTFSKYSVELFTIGKTGGDSLMINDLLNVTLQKAKDAWENGLNSKL
jgi:phosphoribosylformylglycinamidine synthase